MASPEISTLPRDSMVRGDDGGAGAVKEPVVYGRARVCEWLRVYSRVVAMLPRVEALAAAGRARLEAVNALQHEFWEARDAILQHRLLQAEESRRWWEAAYIDLYIDLQPSGDDRRFAELQYSDSLSTFVDFLAAENTEFQIQVKGVDAGAEHSQNAACHENITRDIKAELRSLKQAYKAVCSQKDKAVSQITAERDLVQDQINILKRDYDDLVSCRKEEAIRATEGAQLVQQKVEQLQVASQKKDDEILQITTERDIVQGQIKTLKWDYDDLLICKNKEATRATKAAQELQQKVEHLQVACQKKDDEISQITTERDIAQGQIKTLEQDYDDLLSCRNKETTQATEAAQELQRKVEQLHVASQKKDDDIFQITTERDIVQGQIKTLKRDYDDLLSCRNKETTQATEAAQELQQKVEQLHVASQKKDDEILRLQAQAKETADVTKKTLVREHKLLEVHSMPEKIDGGTEKHKGNQSETDQMPKKDTRETQKKYCSEGPALRGETKNCASEQLPTNEQPETNQKRKCVDFLSDNDGKDGNDEEARKQVLEPLKKKRALGPRVVEQADNETQLVNDRVKARAGRKAIAKDDVPENSTVATMVKKQKAVKKRRASNVDAEGASKRVRNKASPLAVEESNLKAAEDNSANTTELTDQGGPELKKAKKMGRPPKVRSDSYPHRCRPHLITRAVGLMNPKQLKAVKNIPFGGFMGIQLTKPIPKNLLHYMARRVNTQTKMLELKNDKSVKISLADAIEKVTSLENKGEEVPLDEFLGGKHRSKRQRKASSSSMRPEEFIKRFSENRDVEDTCCNFAALVLSCVIAPNTSVNVDAKFLPYVRSGDRMRKFNWNKFGLMYMMTAIDQLNERKYSYWCVNGLLLLSIC